MKKLLFVWLTFLICTLGAETIILGGEVNGVWTQAGSPYMIHNNISIAEGESLQIEPAVEIIFIYNYSLIVFGSLQSEGTITDSIYWTVTDTTGFSDISTPAGGWGGILFDHCDAGIENVLSYNRLEYGKAVGEEMQSYCGGAVRVDSCSVLINNCRLSENLAGNGGAIAVLNGSFITISNNVIINNKAINIESDIGYGGAIYCNYDAGSLIENNLIAGNTAKNSGGGIYFKRSDSLDVENNVIEHNTTAGDAGGIYIYLSDNGIINGNSICHNFSPYSGGGISLYADGVTISENYLSENNSYNGGGIYCGSSHFLTISDNTVENNLAIFGGGILKSFDNTDDDYCFISGNSIRYNRAKIKAGGLGWNGSSTILDEVNRNSIYMNRAILGDDIYRADTEEPVYLDTFTVAMATGAFAYPIDELEFDILHGVLEQENADLYVSPGGDDDNSGLSWTEPLKTLDMATRKIVIEEEERTIYLAEGTYSINSNDEVFPILGLSKVNICGAGKEVTVLDAEGSGMLLYYMEVDSCLISDLTIRNAYIEEMGFMHYYPAAVYVDNSNLKLDNIILRDNVNLWWGGALNIFNESQCELQNVLIKNNSSNRGSIIYADNSEVIADKCQFNNNTSYSVEWSDFPTLESRGGSEILITNTTIADNNSIDGAVLHCDNHSRMSLVNCICYNNSEVELWTSQPEDFEEPLLVSYCDVRGGLDSIWNTHGVAINWLEGNIELDPLFIDPEAGNYELVSWSPCVDSGIDWLEWNDVVLIDLSESEYSGAAPDMGAFEYGDVNTDEFKIENVKLKINNYPNPFNPETTISFSTTEGTENTELSIYNIKGQRVRSFKIHPDIHRDKINHVVWDGRNENGRKVGSGVYLVRLKSEKEIVSKKIMMIK